MSILFPWQIQILKKEFSQIFKILYSIKLTTLFSTHSLNMHSMEYIFVHSTDYIPDTKETSTNIDIKDTHPRFSSLIHTWK